MPTTRLRAPRPALRLTALVTLAAAGCGGDSPTSATSLAGSYRLQSANGTRVPGTVNVPGLGALPVQSGGLDLTSGGSWTMVITGNGGDSLDDAGTYTVSGRTLRFSSSAYGDTFAGTSGGDGSVSISYDLTGGGDVIAAVFTR